jgi:hypothetical protein
MILISNLTPTEFAAAVGPAVMSRMQETVFGAWVTTGPEFTV